MCSLKLLLAETQYLREAHTFLCHEVTKEGVGDVMSGTQSFFWHDSVGCAASHQEEEDEGPIDPPI